MNTTRTARNSESGALKGLSRKEEQSQASVGLRGAVKTGVVAAAAGLALASGTARADLTNVVMLPQFSTQLSLKQSSTGQTDYVKGFNPSLGTLDSVTLLLTGAGSIDVSATDISKYSSKGAESIVLDTYLDTKNSSLFWGNPADAVSDSFSFNLSPGASTYSAQSFTWSIDKTFTSPSVLVQFESGKVSLYESAVANITPYITGGKDSFKVQISECVNGKLFYDYTPCTIPEPKTGELLFGGLAVLAFVTAAGRKMSKAAN